MMNPAGADAEGRGAAARLRVAARRSVLSACAAAVASLPIARAARASEAAAWQALRRGAAVLFRHAAAPGTGDPAGMRLGDCSTQRNLDAAGRAQAARIGDRFRAEKVAVGAVLASRWCRAMDTAELAFPGQARAEPAFDSFFADRGEGPARTAAAKRILLDWDGPGALIVVTHQVNITALTGLVPAAGEGLVLGRSGDELAVLGRVRP